MKYNLDEIKDAYKTNYDIINSLIDSYNESNSIMFDLLSEESFNVIQNQTFDGYLAKLKIDNIEAYNAHQKTHDYKKQIADILGIDIENLYEIFELLNA